jgi:hypothetical protein
LLQNKRAGDSFVFNAKETVIEKIY